MRYVDPKIPAPPGAPVEFLYGEHFPDASMSEEHWLIKGDAFSASQYERWALDTLRYEVEHHLPDDGYIEAQTIALRVPYVVFGFRISDAEVLLDGEKVRTRISADYTFGRRISAALNRLAARGAIVKFARGATAPASTGRIVSMNAYPAYTTHEELARVQAAHDAKLAARESNISDADRKLDQLNRMLQETLRDDTVSIDWVRLPDEGDDLHAAMVMVDYLTMSTLLSVIDG